MTLRIYFKAGGYTEINDFEKITLWSAGTLEEITKDSLSSLLLDDDTTYTVYGKSIAIIKGSNIGYIKLF